MTLNCYNFEFSDNCAGYRRFGKQQQHMNEDRPELSALYNPLNVIFNVVPCVDLPSLGAFTQALLSRAYLSVS